MKSLERLRKSREKAYEACFEKGQAAGRDWSRNRAEFKELERIEELRDTCGNEWLLFFDTDESSAWGVGELLYFVIDPNCNETRQFATDFWDAVLDGDDRRLAYEPEFVRGFAEGALDVWGELKPQL